MTETEQNGCGKHGPYHVCGHTSETCPEKSSESDDGGATEASEVTELDLENLPSIPEIYTAYNYTYEEGEVEPEKLTIDWEQAEQALLKGDLESIFASLKEGSKKSETVIIDINDQLSWRVMSRKDGEESNTRQNSNGGFSNASVFDIKLFNREKNTDNGESSEGQVAHFFWYHDRDMDNQWVSGHRLLKPAYRGQRIGSHMMDMGEKCMQAYANTSDQPENQTLEMPAIQAGITKFALRQEYKPATPEDEQKLREFMDLEKGPQTYFLVSAPGYTGHGNHDRPGFIYRYDKMNKEFGSWCENPPEYAYAKDYCGRDLQSLSQDDREEVLASMFDMERIAYERYAEKINFKKTLEV